MENDQLKRKVASIVPFGLRMQPELKQQIEALAYENGRSLNAEIVWRLEHSLKSSGKGKGLTFTKDIKPPPMSEAETKRLDRVEAELSNLKKQVEELVDAQQKASRTL